VTTYGMKNTPTHIKCGKCLEVKSSDEFHNNASRHNGKAYACKSCDNERKKEYAKTEKGKEGSRRRSKRHREKNPDACREAQRKNKAKKRALIHEKKSGGCIACGYNRCPEALDLHHFDKSTKEGTLANMLHTAGIKYVEEEIKKCVVLCANCHREHHAEGSDLDIRKFFRRLA